MLTYKCSDFIPYHQEFTAFPCAELRTERKHSHEFYELAYVYDGHGSHFDGNELKAVSRGSLILTSPEAEHYFVSPKNNDAPWLMVLDCLFTKQFFDDVLETYLNISILKNTTLYQLIKSNKPFCLLLSDDSNSEIKLYMETIKHKRGINRVGTDILVKNLLLNILIEISTLYDVQLGFPETIQKPLWGIDHLIRYIKANLDINLTLNLLAAQIHLSPSYLSRYFKQKTGKNISEYITELRIEKAKELLVSTVYSVTDICFLCGYSSVPNFRKYFRKATGMSPGEYRKQSIKISL